MAIQSNLYSYTSMLQATRAILAETGVKGLFQGFTATAIRDAPYAGLYVLAYEESKVVCGKSTLLLLTRTPHGLKLTGVVWDSRSVNTEGPPRMGRAVVGHPQSVRYVLHLTLLTTHLNPSLLIGPLGFGGVILQV